MCHKLCEEEEPAHHSSNLIKHPISATQACNLLWFSLFSREDLLLFLSFFIRKIQCQVFELLECLLGIFPFYTPNKIKGRCINSKYFKTNLPQNHCFWLLSSKCASLVRQLAAAVSLELLGCQFLSLPLIFLLDHISFSRVTESKQITAPTLQLKLPFHTTYTPT